MKISRSPGILLLALFLLMFGIQGAFSLSLGLLVPILALIAGIVILMGR